MRDYGVKILRILWVVSALAFGINERTSIAGLGGRLSYGPGVGGYPGLYPGSIYSLGTDNSREDAANIRREEERLAKLREEGDAQRVSIGERYRLDAIASIRKLGERNDFFPLLIPGNPREFGKVDPKKPSTALSPLGSVLEVSKKQLDIVYSYTDSLQSPVPPDQYQTNLFQKLKADRDVKSQNIVTLPLAQAAARLYGETPSAAAAVLPSQSSKGSAHSTPSPNPAPQWNLDAAKKRVQETALIAIQIADEAKKIIATNEKNFSSELKTANEEQEKKLLEAQQRLANLPKPTPPMPLQNPFPFMGDPGGGDSGAGSGTGGSGGRGAGGSQMPQAAESRELPKPPDVNFPSTDYPTSDASSSDSGGNTKFDLGSLKNPQFNIPKLNIPNSAHPSSTIANQLQGAGIPFSGSASAGALVSNSPNAEQAMAANAQNQPTGSAKGSPMSAPAGGGGVGGGGDLLDPPRGPEPENRVTPPEAGSGAAAAGFSESASEGEGSFLSNPGSAVVGSRMPASIVAGKSRPANENMILGNFRGQMASRCKGLRQSKLAGCSWL